MAPRPEIESCNTKADCSRPRGPLRSGVSTTMVIVGANLGPTESKANRPMGYGRSLSSSSYTLLSRFSYFESSVDVRRSNVRLISAAEPSGCLGGSGFCRGPVVFPPPVTSQRQPFERLDGFSSSSFLLQFNFRISKQG